MWETSDRVCGKRLRPLMPVLLAAMERHGHLQPALKVREGLLAMSAATIDRALREVKGQAGGVRRRRAAPSAAVRRSVAVRTFDDWDDPAPGFVEADLVAHSGPTAKGSFVQTLVVTDIATGWTDFAPLLVREQRLLIEVLAELRKQLPFALLEFDTDNDSVFMNETVQEFCKSAGVARWCANGLRSEPSSLFLQSPLPNRDWHTQTCHSIERIASDLCFCTLIEQTPSMKSSANDGLVAIDRCLNQTPSIVTRSTLPAHPTMLRNHRNMPVALTRRCRVRNCCDTRRNNNRSLWMGFGHSIVDCLTIVRTIGR